jgi:hypothetical protein
LEEGNLKPEELEVFKPHNSWVWLVVLGATAKPVGENEKRYFSHLSAR